MRVKVNLPDGPLTITFGTLDEPRSYSVKDGEVEVAQAHLSDFLKLLPGSAVTESTADEASQLDAAAAAKAEKAAAAAASR